MQLQPQTANMPDLKGIADLSVKSERERLTPSALKGFFRIMDAWGVGGEEARRLLGGWSNGKYAQTKAKIERGDTDFPALKQDEITRISFILGIYKSLRILHDHKLANLWVSLNNKNPVFKGSTPLESMLSGGIPSMARVRKLLDGRRGFMQ